MSWSRSGFASRMTTPRIPRPTGSSPIAARVSGVDPGRQEPLEDPSGRVDDAERRVPRVGQLRRGLDDSLEKDVERQLRAECDARRRRGSGSRSSCVLRAQAGASACETPIIESRVTRAASSSSSSDSVPRGRRGHDEVANVRGRVDDAELHVVVERRRRTQRGRLAGRRPHAIGREGSCTSPAAGRAAPWDSTSRACRRPCGARVSVFSSATTTGDGPGSSPSSSAAARASARRRCLKLRVDPGARDEPCTVGRRARDEPVDARAHVLARDHALLDEQLLERANARRGRRFARRDRSDRAWWS